MIHLYTGDGKGKTTAAVGLAVRARGHGWRVLFVQFLKGGPSGELDGLRQLGVEILRPSDPHGFWWQLDSLERARLAAEHDGILRTVKARLDGATPPQLLVLDEFTYVYATPMANRALCRAVLDDAAAKGIETVVTGRNPGALATRADYLSEIRAVRHPFAHGLPARPGIEF